MLLHQQTRFQVTDLFCPDLLKLMLQQPASEIDSAAARFPVLHRVERVIHKIYRGISNGVKRSLMFTKSKISPKNAASQDRTEFHQEQTCSFQITPNLKSWVPKKIVVYTKSTKRVFTSCFRRP